MSGHRKVFLEITNRCNLSCTFCPGCKRPAHMLTMEEFLKIAPQTAEWAEYLYFHLMGEPLTHPLLPEFIKHTWKLGMRPMLTTNGTLLSRCEAALLQPEQKPYKISISLHAFEANDISVPFEDYIESCLSFASLAAGAGIIVALRLWNLDGRAEGALHQKNEAVIVALHKAFGENWRENRSGYRLGERVFLEWGEKFDWPSLPSPVLQEEGFCYGLRDQIGILCDGTVVPCCLDAEGDIPLGNIFETPLSSILTGARAKALYDGFTAHHCTKELCKRCMRAGYYRTEST